MKDKLSRREAIELGLGTAIAGAAGRLVAAADTESSSSRQEGNGMTALSEFNKYGEELENHLLLRTSPIAVKMLEKEADIPEGAVRPSKDRGYHLAQCQAFAMSRREGTTVAMLKEDHWCPTAPMAYGMVDRPESIASWTHPYDCFEQGKYVGIVTAPLKNANFMPDVVIIYANPAQLRGLLLTLPVADVPSISGHFFPPSCGWAVVTPMMSKQCYVVIPDPGEYQRALTQEGDMMFSIPQEKMPAMMANVRKNEHGPFSYRDHHMFMQPDFEQPEFYKELFKSWGLE
jgi:uncharacterized protein (DUF169 family)